MRVAAVLTVAALGAVAVAGCGGGDPSESPENMRAALEEAGYSVTEEEVTNSTYANDAGVELEANLRAAPEGESGLLGGHGGVYFTSSEEDAEKVAEEFYTREPDGNYAAEAHGVRTYWAYNSDGSEAAEPLVRDLVSVGEGD